MKKTSFFNSLPFKLLVAVILGIIAGLILNRYSTNGISMAVLNITVTIKYILGQLITFCVPLIVLGFIAPSITRLGKNASLMLGVAVVLAYGSSVGAALFSTASGFLIIPHLSIHSYAAGLKRLPEVIFELEIPQIMSVMSALVFAMMLGLAATWTKAKLITGSWMNFRKSFFLWWLGSSSPFFRYLSALPSAALLRGNHHQTAACFSEDHRTGACRAFYLDGSSLHPCRYLFRRKSSGGCPPLWSCLPDCHRDHVLCSHPGRCTAVCLQGKTTS